MKLINPILQTINNTLHIKADNLEAVEVDSSCVDELSDLVFKDTKWFIKGKTNDKYYLSRGVEISELSDRIFISRKWKPLTDFCNDCGSGTHKNQCDNADSGCIHFTSKAFLLPVKETKCDGTCADNECICAEVRRQEWIRYLFQTYLLK
jgi:hypothetical protein